MSKYERGMEMTIEIVVARFSGHVEGSYEGWRRSGSKKMTEVVQEGGDACNGNGIDCKREMSRSRK